MTETTTNPGGRSAAELEREVDQEREHISHAIDALQEKISVGSIVDQVVQAVSRHGGDVGRNLGSTIKHNPLPLALTGIGLAWLMSSSGRERHTHDGPYYGGERYPHDPGYVPPRPLDSGAPGDLRGRPSGEIPAAAGYPVAGAGSTAATGYASDDSRSRAAAARDKASAAAHAASARASGAAHTAGDAAKGAAGAVRSAGAHAASSAQSGASAAGEAVRAGAHRAGDAARDGAHRVGAAAEYAGSQARHGAEYVGHRAADAGRYARDGFDDLLENQPLVLGALALAVGAAIGGALPRTRREDEALGPYRDRAFDEAAAVAHDQATKAQAVAGAVAGEAEHMADEALGEADRRTPGGGEMVDRAEAKAREAAGRLRDTAAKEADRQNLGKPDKPAAG